MNMDEGTNMFDDHEFDDIKRFARLMGIPIRAVVEVVDREREKEFWEIAARLRDGGLA